MMLQATNSEAPAGINHRPTSQLYTQSHDI